MLLSRIMSTDVKSVSPDTLVSRAAEIMRVNNVGCLPVTQRGRLVGLVTDRDIVVRGLGDQRDCSETLVSSIMTLSPHALSRQDQVCDALALMRHNRIRRVPIVDDSDQLVGIVTLSDIALRAHEPIQAGAALLSICGAPSQAALELRHAGALSSAG